MKRIFLSILFLSALATGAQAQILKGAGILYFDSLVNVNANTNGAELAWSIKLKKGYRWDRTLGQWIEHPTFTGNASGTDIVLDTITQTAHGFRKMDAVLDTSTTSTPGFIRGNTSAADMLPSHLVVDSLDANNFVIQSGGYVGIAQTRYTSKQVYYLQDDGSLDATPDAQYNFPVIGISNAKTKIYLRIDALSQHPWVTGVTTETGTTRTLSLADLGEMILMEHATGDTISIPLNSSVPFSIGVQIEIVQSGSGQTVFLPASGVTMRSADAADRLRTQYSSATLTKIGTDEWLLVGDITN